MFSVRPDRRRRALGRRRRCALAELVRERRRVVQVRRVEPLGEGRKDPSERAPGVVPPPEAEVQAREARRRPQLPRPRMLLAGETKGLEKAGLRLGERLGAKLGRGDRDGLRVRTAATGVSREDRLALESVELGLEVALAAALRDARGLVDLAQ